MRRTLDITTTGRDELYCAVKLAVGENLITHRYLDDQHRFVLYSAPNEHGHNRPLNVPEGFANLIGTPLTALTCAQFLEAWLDEFTYPERRSAAYNETKGWRIYSTDWDLRHNYVGAIFTFTPVWVENRRLYKTL